MNLTQFTGMQDRRNKLYYDDDLLLSINATFNIEHYKRIHFKDMQSIQIIRTASWIWIGILQALFIAIFGLITLAVYSESNNSDDVIVAFFLGIIPLILIVFFIINISRGPTCRTYACSAVQRLELYAINRVRRAELLLRTIESKITAVQDSGPIDVQEAILELVRKPRSPKPTRPSPPPTDDAATDTDEHADTADPSDTPDIPDSEEVEI